MSSLWVDLYPTLIGIARRVLSQPDHEHDVVQQTMLDLLEKSEAGLVNFDLDSREAIGWLLAWTRGNAHRTNRVEGRYTSLTDDGVGVVQSPYDLIERRLVARSLCNSETEVAVLSQVMDGWTQQEIATGLGVAQGTVSKLLADIISRGFAVDEQKLDVVH